MAFVPLFCQSHHSPLGVNAPADLAKRARALGYTTLGLCDEVTIAGFLEFEDACRAQGLRPVFGCRLFMDGFSLQGQTFPIDFLIESEQGYRNLVRLLNVALRNGCGARRPLFAAELRERTQGLTTIIPPDGELATLVAMKNRSRTEHFLRQAVDYCGEGLVFGFDPPVERKAGENERDEPGREPEERLSQGEASLLMLQLARFVHVRAMAAARIEHAESGDAAAAVFLQNPQAAPARQYKPPPATQWAPALDSEEEVLARWNSPFEDLPHEAGNVARRCTWRPGRMRRVYPSMDLERGFDPNSYLFDLAIRGATQRYGEISEWLKQRINKEMEDIRANNLAPHMLLNYQITHALDQRGMSRGVGRGRLVSSVIAYCLGITRLDPTVYRLAVRSLMLEQEQLPPVNIEVPRSTVPQVLTWVRETFGEGHFAEIGRIQEWRRDQMINELANWAGMTSEERKLVHREKARLRSAGAAQRLGEMAGSNRARRWRDASFLGDVAARLAPRPRAWMATGDRYVLSSEPLDAITPLVPAQQGRPVTGLEEDALDRLGLARINFVPHQLLDILDFAMQLARTQQPAPHLEQIPLDDRQAFELISRGDTQGIPPFESITLRCMLRRNAPANLLRVLGVKNEAGNAMGVPTGERPRELGDHLPDVLLSYQCAWLKAHYPLAFFGAVLSAALEARENPITLLRAARRLGFQILPPDINFSGWLCTLHAGQIRLGLAAVKGFGQRAWENVQGVRTGGNFTTLEDFCERIDMRLVTLRALRALVGSGALDGLDPQRNRARMDARLTRLQRRARERNQAAGESEPQPSLFDMEELPVGEETADNAENFEDWNDFDKEARQGEALGFPLRSDPVRQFKLVDSHLQPLQIEQVVMRPVGRTLRVAGIVAAAERAAGLIEKSEDTLIDLEGIPVLLGTGLARHATACLEQGSEVLVVGRMQKGPGCVLLVAEGIWRLADLEDQATRVGSIRLKLAGENRHTLKLLIALAKSFPGGTQLKLMNYPGRMGWTYRRLARLAVFFCSPFYQGLCKILPPEAVELFDLAGNPLLVKTAPTDEAGAEDDEAPPE